MASVVLLLSELLGGESASVAAADRYIMGGRLSGLGRELFRPAATSASASAAKQQSERPAAGIEEEKQRAKEESFEDLAVSRIAVDVMWP